MRSRKNQQLDDTRAATSTHEPEMAAQRTTVVRDTDRTNERNGLHTDRIEVGCTEVLNSLQQSIDASGEAIRIYEEASISRGFQTTHTYMGALRSFHELMIRESDALSTLRQLGLFVTDEQDEQHVRNECIYSALKEKVDYIVETMESAIHRTTGMSPPPSSPTSFYNECAFTDITPQTKRHKTE